MSPNPAVWPQGEIAAPSPNAAPRACKLARAACSALASAHFTVSNSCGQITYQQHEAASYSMTLSARSSSEGGIVRPRALAVFMLITNSNAVGCSIARSPGSAPFRILSTYVAAFR